MQEIRFSFDGVSYAVDGQVQFGGSIQLPDGRYLLVQSWNKTNPPTPAEFKVVEIPLIGGKIWQARHQSQIQRPNTMDPHDQSRQTPARDPYRGFPRGIMSVFFKPGTTNEQIDRALAEFSGLDFVASATHLFPNDPSEQIRLLADVRLVGGKDHVDDFVTRTKCYPEIAGTHEVLPQICFPFGRGAQKAPVAMMAPRQMMPALPGGQSSISTDFQGFPRGMISVLFKSGTSNATIADVLRRAQRYLRYVESTNHPFPKYAGKGQDILRRNAWVKLSDPLKTEKAIAWLLKQPSVRAASEVLPQICL